MPFKFDYLPVQPYEDRLAPTLANVMGGAERAQAAGTAASGQAWAQGVEKSGQAVSSTLNNLMAIKLQQQQQQRAANTPQAQLATLRARGLMQDQADDQAMRRAMSDAGGDPDKALEALRTSGGASVDAIGKFEKQIGDARRIKLSDEGARLDQAIKGLHTVSDMLPEPPIPPSDPNDEAAAEKYEVDKAIFQGKYKETLPELGKVMGPHAQGLPSPDDPDLVTRVTTIRDAGMTSAEKLAKHKSALEDAKAALDAGRDTQVANDRWTKAGATELSLASNQDEWTASQAGLKKAGAPDAVLAKFGTEWSPEAAARARQLGMTPTEQDASQRRDTPKLGSLEDVMQSWAKDHNTPVEAMTFKQREQAARSWALTQHVTAAGELTGDKQAKLVQAVMDHPDIYGDLTPDMKGKIAGDLASKGFTQFGRAITPATILSAGRFRTTSLAKIDEDETSGILSADKAQDQRDQVEELYQATVSPTSKPAVGPTQPAAPAPAPAPAPAQAPAKPAALPPPTAGKVQLSIPAGMMPGTTGPTMIEFDTPAKRDAFMKKYGLTLKK